MFGLVYDFVARKRKQAASAQGLTAPGAEVHDGKYPKMVGPDEEDQKSLMVINVDFPD